MVMHWIELLPTVREWGCSEVPCTTCMVQVVQVVPLPMPLLLNKCTFWQTSPQHPATFHALNQHQVWQKVCASMCHRRRAASVHSTIKFTCVVRKLVWSGLLQLYICLLERNLPTPCFSGVELTIHCLRPTFYSNKYLTIYIYWRVRANNIHLG